MEFKAKLENLKSEEKELLKLKKIIEERINSSMVKEDMAADLYQEI